MGEISTGNWEELSFIYKWTSAATNRPHGVSYSARELVSQNLLEFNILHVLWELISHVLWELLSSPLKRILRGGKVNLR